MKTFSFFLTNFDVLVGQSVGSFENKVYIKTKVPHDPSQIISGFAYFDTKIALGTELLLNIIKEFNNGDFRFKIIETKLEDVYFGSETKTTYSSATFTCENKIA